MRRRISSGRDAEGGRGLVHQALDRKRDDRARHAAIGRHGAGVGGDAARAAGIGAHVVRPRQFRHRHQRLDAAGGRKARIGADIGDDVGLERDELGGGVEAAFQFDILVAAVKARDQIFAPVFAPGKRAAKPPGQIDQHGVFGRQRHFLPEAAADIGRDDAQFGFRESEHVGDRGAHQMRHLGRAGEGDPAARGVIGRVRATRLERRRVLAVGAQRDGDAPFRLRHRDIEFGRGKNAFDHDIAGAIVVHQRRAGFERLARIDQRRPVLDLDRDLIGDVLGLGGGRREYGGEGFADKAHHVLRQDRLRDRPVIELVQHRRDRPHAGKIGAGDDWRTVRRGDGDDAPGRHWAADKAHRISGGEIGGEAAAALDQRRVFQPPHRAADPFRPKAFGRARHRLFITRRPRCGAREFAPPARSPRSPAHRACRRGCWGTFRACAGSTARRAGACAPPPRAGDRGRPISRRSGRTR